MILWAAFAVGWIVHLLAQAHRSVSSGANGLSGLRGMGQWFKLQIVPILIRGWASTIYFGIHTQKIAPHTGSVLPMNLWTVTGLGFTIDEALDKILVLLLPSTWPSGLKVDIPLLVPPKENTKQKGDREQ